MDLNNLETLSRISGWAQGIVIGLIIVLAIAQASKYFIDRRLSDLKESRDRASQQKILVLQSVVDSQQLAIKNVDERTKTWRLTDDQIAKMATVLRKHKDIKVRIIAESSPDLEPFTRQLERLFNEAQWTIVESSISFDKAYDGISIFGGGKPETDAPAFIADLYRGLQHAGVQLEKPTADSSLPLDVVGIQIGKSKRH